MKSIARLMEISQKEERKLEEKYLIREPGTTRILFEDCDLSFSDAEIRLLIKEWRRGKSLLRIAETLNRDPDEVFLCLFDQARSTGKVITFDINQIWSDRFEVG